MNTINFMCPACNIEIQPLGISHLIKPFWQNIPKFLLYPLKPAPIGLLLLFGIIAGLAHHTLTFSLFVTFLCFVPVYLICLFIILIYCNNVFVQTSKGDINPPFTDISLEGIPWYILKQVLLLSGISFLGYTVNRHIGLSYALAACELMKIPFPAMFILLLVNGSLISAINPLYVLLLIKKIGSHYFYLYLLTSVLLLAAFGITIIISHLTGTSFPLAPAIFYSLINYALIVFYHLLGYVMLQYNEELGVPIDYLTFLRFNTKEQLEKNIKSDPLYHDAQLLVSQGKAESALELIRNESKGKFENPDLALLYLKLIDLQDENDKLRWVGGPIIDLMTSCGRKRDSIALYRKCFRDKPIVCPEADTLNTLHGWFLKGKQYQEALQCAESLIEKYPKNQRVPDLYLTCAGLALSQFKDRKKAAVLIQHYLKQYPDHGRRKDAEKMALWLKKTARKPVKN